MRQIQLIEVKSEIGAGTRGASLGVDAIKIAAINKGDGFFKDHSTVQVEVENNMLYEPVTTPHARRIEGIVKIYERVCDAVKGVLSQNQVAVVVAGDHSTSGGTIAGIKTAFPGKRVGVVWIDAHADLHSPYTSPSGNVHGMPVAAALGIDNIENKRNNVVDETREAWEKLKTIGGNPPKLLPQDMVYVALRDTEPEEDYIINHHKINVISVSDIRQIGAAQTASEILDYLKGVDILYVSFDVDSLDSSISVGTGTPVANGLTVTEAADMISVLVNSPKLVCFELVEVNPLLDNKGNLMAETAFDILKLAHQTIANN